MTTFTGASLGVKSRQLAERGDHFRVLGLKPRKVRISAGLGDFGWEGLDGAVDDDGSGEHDGQVRLDGVTRAVEHGLGIEIGL